jgi:hypothetical protein
MISTPGPEPLLHAEVYLDHGDRQEIAKVLGLEERGMQMGIMLDINIKIPFWIHVFLL